MTHGISLAPIQKQLAQVGYPVSESSSLPPACYHHQQWLDHEIDLLFKKKWICAGRSDQWSNIGDYRTIRIADVSIVITRTQTRELKALSNVCLHRCSEIMSDHGQCKAMVCPFHGWGYDLEGQLISAPRMETASNFNIENQRLKSFSIAETQGFVFINLGDAATSIEETLEDFDDIHRPWELGNLVTTRSRRFQVACNWKLFIEVFNEYYHLPFVHADSISDRYPEPDPVDIVMGEYTTQFGATEGNPALLDGEGEGLPSIPSLQGRNASGTRYTWIYPNVTFAASYDCLWMYHVYPIDAVSTEVVQTVCFPRASVERYDFDEKAKDYYERIDVAIAEDIPVLEKQQRGMESPHAIQGRFSALEPSVGNFACWYSDQLKA